MTWIKLRDDLESDPRLARMASLLAGTATSYVLPAEVRDLFGSVTKAVTRHAMRDVTLAGLTRVWSHANRHTQDGVFRDVELDYLDDLARIPGFGRAMQAVGWAIHDTETNTLTLPNFTEHNAPDKNGQRSQTAAARRAQRYRDRLKNTLPDPPVNDVNPVHPVPNERDGITSRVTPTPVTQPVTSDVTPSISDSVSSSLSESKSENSGSGKEESRGENPPLRPLDLLTDAKTRINRLRGSWAKLPHWSQEEEAALYAALPNLRQMEDQDWAMLAFWLRWAHSAANTQSRDPVRVTSRRHVFLQDISANLDRATTHWKQCGSPRLNPDGTKSTPALKVLPKPAAEDPPLTQGAANFMQTLAAFGGQIPTRTAATVATNPRS